MSSPSKNAEAIGKKINCAHTRTFLEGHQLCIFAEGMEAGQEIEQERIIKLLEGYALKKCDVHCAYSCECFGKYEAQRFIALIKGEQK